MKRLMLFFVGIWLVLFSMQAQSLKGFITDKETSLPLEGVNISIQSSSQGSVSQKNGFFELNNLTLGSHLVIFSRVGYQNLSQTIRLKRDQHQEIRIQMIPEEVLLDSIDVLANRQQRVMTLPQTEPLSLLPTISLVSSKNIEQQGATTLVEALRYVPGAWIETRGRKVKQFVSIRGQKYPYPDYSINGIWQKEFHESSYIMASAEIESIEVLRSSAALLNGLSGLTGVINIKTKEYTSSETSAMVKYGTFNTLNTTLSHGGKSGKVSYATGISYEGTSGPEGRNSQEQIGNAYGNLIYRPNQEITVRANMFYLYGKRELTQPEEPADPKFRNWVEKYDPIRTFLSSAKMTWRPNEKYTTEIQANFAHRLPHYERFDIKKNTTTSSYLEKDYEYSLNITQAIAFSPSNTLRFGGLYNHWVAPEGKRFYYGKPCDVHTFSAVVVDEHKLGNLSLDGGLRFTKDYYEEYGAFSIEGSGGKFRKVEPITNEWQRGRLQVTLGASYLLGKGTSAHFNFAGGSIKPRKGAMDDNGAPIDDEIRLKYDLGIHHKFAGGQVTLTGFYVDRQQAIDYSGKTFELDNGDLMETYTNHDKRHYGLEMDFQSPRLASLFSLFANATWMKGEVNQNEKWTQDEEMPNFIANAGINLAKSNFDLNVFANYMGAYENDRFLSKDYIKENGKAPLGDFTHMDLTAGYTFGQKLNTRAFVEVKNVLDQRYQTVVGYPDFGRKLNIGVKTTF